MAHVDPAEQTGAAFEAPDTHRRQPLHQPSPPLPQPPLVLRNVRPGELAIPQQRRQQVLRLRRNQPKARHLGGRRHHAFVTGVYRPDTEPGESEVLGEAAHNVDAAGGGRGGRRRLGDADEAPRRSAGVDFVADEVEVVSGCDEVEEGGELAVGEGGAERVGGIGDEDALHAEAPLLCAAAGGVEGRPGDAEAVGTGTGNGDDLHSGSPFEIPIEPAPQTLALRQRHHFTCAWTKNRVILFIWKFHFEPYILKFSHLPQDLTQSGLQELSMMSPLT